MGRAASGVVSFRGEEHSRQRLQLEQKPLKRRERADEEATWLERMSGGEG